MGLINGRNVLEIEVLLGLVEPRGWVVAAETQKMEPQVWLGFVTQDEVGSTTGTRWGRLSFLLKLLDGGLKSLMLSNKFLKHGVEFFDGVMSFLLELVVSSLPSFHGDHGWL